MGAIASQIASLTIVFSTVYLDTDQIKHQSSLSLAFVWGIHRRPVNSPHKWSVTRKMFPFDDAIIPMGLFNAFILLCDICGGGRPGLTLQFDSIHCYVTVINFLSPLHWGQTELGPFYWDKLNQHQDYVMDIRIDTNIEVIVVSLTTWEAHHSPRAKPEGFGELPRSLMRQQWPKSRYQFLFYHDETKLMMNKQILSI